MGADVEGLAAEPVAGAAKAGDHLVRDQKDFVFVADALDFGPVAVRRDDHAACALNGFGDEGRDVFLAQFEDLGLQLARALKPEVFGAVIAPFQIPMRLVDMVDAGNGQAALGMHPRHAAKAAAAHGAAVIAVLARDDMGLGGFALHRPIVAHKADVGVICFRTGPCEKDMVQIARRKL